MYIIYNEELVKTDNKNEKQHDKNETNKKSIYYT